MRSHGKTIVEDSSQEVSSVVDGTNATFDMPVHGLNIYKITFP
jgi:hypothetical protein